MTKRIIVFILCICSYTMGLHAQVNTNTKELKKAGAELKIEENNNYIKALSLARENGWPLVIKGKNNSVSKLVGIDAFGFPRYYTTYNNTIAAATTGASQLWPGGNTGLNLSGSTAAMKNKLAIWDDGSPLTTHIELTGRVTVKDNGTPSDHATHVAGTMIATGINPVAKGMSFGAQGIISYDFGGFTGLDIPNMFIEAGGLLLSNHSYGATAGWAFNSDSSRWEFYAEPGATEDYKFGYYDVNAQLKDSIAYNAPYYLIVTAAGNNRAENGPAVGQPYYRLNSSGKMVAAGNRPAGLSSNDAYNIISLDANAKNMLTVGAVSGIAAGYSKPQDVIMSSFSSWGPTDDGRIKPDIVADGVDVTSSIATSNNAYGTFSGTSMATPNTTGSLFLLQEYFSQLKSGAFMRSATLKGLAIHTADEAGASPGPDYQFGWGLLDVKNAAAVIKAAVTTNNASTSQHLLYENVLDNAAQQTFTLNVTASGNGPLIATICWTDVKGNVDQVNRLNNPTPKLVNDLDIRITKGATTYFPWKLDPANPSAAATKGDNILDNVERINIDSVVPGQTYTITVSHKGTLARGSQAYSLLVSGVGGNAYCTIAAAANTGTHIDSVAFSGIHNKNTAACTTYNDYTGLTADIQSNQTLPITVTVNKCDGSAAPKLVKVFIDYNNNGVFTDAGELVATGSIPAGAGTQTFNTNITFPAGLQKGNYSIIRIVAQETTDASTVTSCGSPGNGETQDYRVRIVQPANDAALSTLVAPISGSCSGTSQYVVVTIQNKGTLDLSNIPVSAIIKNGAATVATINNVYRGTIPGGAAVTYTLQTPFSSVAGTTYTIIAYTAAAGDQSKSNDTLTSIVSIASNTAAPAGVATICGNQANLKINSPVSGASYFWYTTPTGTIPLASGASTSTSTIPSNNTYYAGSGAAVSIGPVNKSALGAGGYNNFAGNYVSINASVPVTIKFAKLYIGNPGQINFVVADTLSGNRYVALSSTTIDAYVTNPAGTATPPTGSTATPDNPADTGAYFYLNLSVPVGNHVIFINPQVQPQTTIFRNNAVTGSPYPFSIPGIFSITGNSAGTPFQSFYYFFYDMKITTNDCPGDRATVIAAPAASQPTIAQVADSLVSSAATGNQWYLNNVAIPNATGKSYKPVQSGLYNVIATDPAGCAQASNSINFVATAVVDLNGTAIGLVVSPNPSNGLFNIVFEVKERADLSIEVLNLLGQNVYSKTYPGFIGRFSGQLNLPAAARGTYVLKIGHHNKLYVKKLLVSK